MFIELGARTIALRRSAMLSMPNLNPQATLVQSRVILFLHHIALLWSATINNSGSINIALLRSEDFCKLATQHNAKYLS